MCRFDKNPICFTAFTITGENRSFDRVEASCHLESLTDFASCGRSFVLQAINVTRYIPHSLVFAAHFFCANVAIERVDVVFSRLQEWICFSPL